MSESLPETLVRSAGAALANGVRLKQWWEQRERYQNYPDRFDLRRSFNPAGASYGFFDTAPLSGGDEPVLGMVQEMRFDTAKAGPPDRMRDELRQFVLQYLMRLSSFKEPEAYSTAKSCGRTPPELAGFGYSQLYYKLFGAVSVSAFSPELKTRIVDLRETLSTYEWILLHVDLYSFNLRFQPFGPDALNLMLPLAESTYLVLNRDFLIDDSTEHDDVIGRYGFGYAVIKNPKERILAWGPGEFDVGFQNFEFTILSNGESSVRMAFVVNRPRRIFNAAVDPVYTFIDAANLLTAGAAARLWCISRRELEIRFMAQHYIQHYDMILGALSTWSQVRDWLDESQIPRWVLTGKVE